MSDYRWAPTSDKIVYSNPVGGYEGGLWVVTLEGQKTQLLNFGEYPDWSPEGGMVAFQTGSGGGIAIIPDSGGVPQILCTAGFMPRWSPDGAHIAFYQELGGVISLYLMNATGGEPQLLTEAGSDFDWSPASDRLVFHRYEGGEYGYSYNIKVVDIATRSATVLWSGGTSPRWAPEGSRIVFEGVSGAELDGLFVMNPDGGSVERVSPNGANPVFRLNSNTVVFERNDGVWVAYRE